MTAPAAEADQTEIMRAAPRKTLAIACGALAREMVALSRGPLGGLDVTCLPAQLHNRPERIPEAIRRKIRENRARCDEILVVYGDCGTGGALDVVLAEENVPRIAGPHCYAFYAGEDAIAAMMAEEPGSFFVTDFLARHFDRLVIRGLGLDRFPDLRNDYFHRYKRLVYLAQTEDADLTARAEAAAARLGLAFERRYTGLGVAAEAVATARRTDGSGKSRCRQAPRSERRSGAPASSGATK
ncbi:MAG: DUF1638 domain-containing protein [Roseiarcus sp.]|jgi:hypothetical protein